jgi:OOP family OmpA-OmpF porin
MAGRSGSGVGARWRCRAAGLALSGCLVAGLTAPCAGLAQPAAGSPADILSSAGGPRVTGSDAAPLILIRRAPDSIEIRGSIADDALRAELLSAVRAVFPGHPVTTISGDLPGPIDREVLRSAVTALGLLRFLAVGDAAIHPDEVRLRGDAFHTAARTSLAEAAAAAGIRVSAEDVGVGQAGPSRPAAACQAEIASLVRERPIEFDPGRATLAGAARDIVDHVVYALSACPDAPVAVAGHTDSDGTDEANHRLSLARARTVIDMMVANGLAAERFTPLGYGESRPLASNATERGKAINRRIEVLLRD